MILEDFGSFSRILDASGFFLDAFRYFRSLYRVIFVFLSYFRTILVHLGFLGVLRARRVLSVESLRFDPPPLHFSDPYQGGGQT